MKTLAWEKVLGAQKVELLQRLGSATAAGLVVQGNQIHTARALVRRGLAERLAMPPEPEQVRITAFGQSVLGERGAT